MFANLVEPCQTFTTGFSLSEVTLVDHFVAREEELTEIHKELAHKQGRRTIIVHGLGGVGKTQLAAAYAKRQRDKYSAIFWMNAKDEISLKQGYMRVAERISREHMSEAYIKNAVESCNLDKAVQAVKRWLDIPKNNQWLVIYDNYDNPKLAGNRNSGLEENKADEDTNTTSKDYDIRSFLPDAYHGAILITTRSSRVKIGHRISLGKLKRLEDSLEILAHTSNRQNLYNGM